MYYICHIIGYDFYDISNDVQGKIEQFGIHDFFHQPILLMWSVQLQAQFKNDTIIPLGAWNTLARVSPEAVVQVIYQCPSLIIISYHHLYRN